MKWKGITDYEGYYEVSSTGLIKSLDRVIITTRGQRRIKGRIMASDSDRKGYPIVHLCKYCKKSTKQIHRLVAKAFIPLVKDKNIVSHKDGNPQNNNISNLEWCTYSENTQHAHDTGLIVPCRGSANPNSKLTTKDAESIIKIYAKGNISMRGVARLYPQVSFTTVLKVIKGLKWPHLKRPLYQ